jgi:predicted MarR family transcription regulator
VLPRRQGTRRIPALRFGDPRVIALFAALLQLSYQAAGFRHAQLRRSVAALLGRALEGYSTAQMTYDLARLAAHGLIERQARTHRYRPTAEGLRIAAILTKLNDRLLAPALARATAIASPHQPRWESFDRALRGLCEDAQLAA